MSNLHYSVDRFSVAPILNDIVDEVLQDLPKKWYKQEAPALSRPRLTVADVLKYHKPNNPIPTQSPNIVLGWGRVAPATPRPAMTPWGMPAPTTKYDDIGKAYLDWGKSRFNKEKATTGVTDVFSLMHSGVKGGNNI